MRSSTGAHAEIAREVVSLPGQDTLPPLLDREKVYVLDLDANRWRQRNVELHQGSYSSRRSSHLVRRYRHA